MYGFLIDEKYFYYIRIKLYATSFFNIAQYSCIVPCSSTWPFPRATARQALRYKSSKLASSPNHSPRSLARAANRPSVWRRSAELGCGSAVAVAPDTGRGRRGLVLRV